MSRSAALRSPLFLSLALAVLTAFGATVPSVRSGRLSAPIRVDGRPDEWAGVNWAQEFLDTFDAMSRPTIGTKRFSFAVEVTLADAN